jgi:hypothetical protein
VNAARQGTGVGPGLWSCQCWTTAGPASSGAQLTTWASIPSASTRAAAGNESASNPADTATHGRSGTSPNPGASGEASAAR